MFIRKYKDRWRFGERYKDPHTNKWRTVTISAERNTRNTRHEAQIILDKKIEKKLTEITGELLSQADMTLVELLDTYWTEKEKCCIDVFFSGLNCCYISYIKALWPLLIKIINNTGFTFTTVIYKVTLIASITQFSE